MATVLCDLQVIHGVETGITIGDALPVWEQTFSAGGRYRNGNAVLVFMATPGIDLGTFKVIPLLKKRDKVKWPV